MGRAPCNLLSSYISDFYIRLQLSILLNIRQPTQIPRSYTVMTVLSFCFSIIVAGVAIMECAGQSHPFTVKDDIEMTRFSNPRSVPGLVDNEVAQRSPNGKYFAVVTTKGILKSDRLASKIAIFDTTDVSATLNSATNRLINPRVIATVVSFPHHHEVSSYASVITDVRWSLDSTRVYYIGEELDGTYRLYFVKINGSAPVALTPRGQSVTQYVIAGDMIIYREEPEHSQLQTPDGFINADARAVTGQSLRDILFSEEIEDTLPKISTMHFIRMMNGRRVSGIVTNSAIRQLTFAPGVFTPIAISPDGRQVIELSPVKTVPTSWESYKPAPGLERMRFHADDPRLTSADNLHPPQRYTLVDLGDGRRQTLIDAPDAVPLGYGYFANRNGIVWAKDDQRVLITNTFLPIDHVSDAIKTERLRPCLVAVVDVQTFAIHCFMFTNNDPYTDGVNLTNLSFGKSKDEVVLQTDSPAQKRLVQRYSYHNGSWELVEAKPQDELRTRNSAQGGIGGEDLQLIVEESLNDPPTLWVRSNRTGQSRQLWNPNPQFAHIRFGEVSVYRWKDKNGYEWTGGLVKPVGYIPGHRYPLVLQMYEFIDHQFMTDGDAPTAFAARHLASNGIIVLQIQRKTGHTMNDAEVQDHLEGYRSAIEHLSNDGLVDPSKVGVVGFSWTCWYVEHALIKAPKLFTAATVADGTIHSYMDYLVVGVSNSQMQEQDDKIFGAEPFGVGLKQWIEMASGFNLNKVQTPLRIEAMTPVHLLEEWEIYSSLQMQHKPVDLIYFPFGSHIHQKPLERLESQQGDVDWFRFWLQGYEDPDPAKRSEYRRWENLRGKRSTYGTSLE